MTAPADAATIWDRQRIWVTLGAVALIFSGRSKPSRSPP